MRRACWTRARGRSAERRTGVLPVRAGRRRQPTDGALQSEHVTTIALPPNVIEAQLDRDTSSRPSVACRSCCPPGRAWPARCRCFSRRPPAPERLRPGRDRCFGTSKQPTTRSSSTSLTSSSSWRLSNDRRRKFRPHRPAPRRFSGSQNRGTLRLEAGQPARVVGAGGTSQDVSGRVLSRQEILAIVGPIVPDHARRQLPKEPSVSFD